MTLDMTRRRFLAALAASSTIAVPGMHALAASGSLNVQLSWLKTVEFGGMWLAESKGYFAERGVAVNWLGGGPNVGAIAPIVVGGQADIGIDQLQSVADAASKGSDLVALAAIFQKSPGGVMSLPANPVRTAKDLLGKRIGIQGNSTKFLNAILDINGLPHDYTTVPVGFDPTPLAEGACDAMSCFVTNQPVTLTLQGVENIAVAGADLGLPGYADSLYVTRAYLDANRELLVNFLEASLRGWIDYLADLQSAVDQTVSTFGVDLGLDPAQQLAVAKAQVPLIESPTGKLLAIDVDLVRGAMYDGFKISGSTNLPDPDRLVDPTLLEEARARL